MDAGNICMWIIVVIIAIVMMFVLMSAIKIIKPYEMGLYEKLGKFQRVLNPGLNFVAPFISDVHRIDMRTQTLDVPRQEVITKDNSPVVVDAIVYIHVVDPIKAKYEVQDYRMATVALAQTTLRSTIGEMELDEILSNRVKINARVRDELDKSTDPWGVKVEMVEIREVDPQGKVKIAMMEQTAAERDRRAAILRADGKKRAAILEAEGAKRAMILRAEGSRQSKILQAEGDRMAAILRSQGEAQRLRILALGAATLDQKSLSVLSLEAVKKMGDGKATKIILPFELTRLIEGISEYVGAGRKIGEHTPSTIEKLEEKIGKAEDVLGKIPRQSEVQRDLQDIKDEIEAESAITEQLIGLKKSKDERDKNEGNDEEFMPSLRS